MNCNGKTCTECGWRSVLMEDGSCTLCVVKGCQHCLNATICGKYDEVYVIKDGGCVECGQNDPGCYQCFANKYLKCKKGYSFNSEKKSVQE